MCWSEDELWNPFIFLFHHLHKIEYIICEYSSSMFSYTLSQLLSVQYLNRNCVCQRLINNIIRYILYSKKVNTCVILVGYRFPIYRAYLNSQWWFSLPYIQQCTKRYLVHFYLERRYGWNAKNVHKEICVQVTDYTYMNVIDKHTKEEEERNVYERASASASASTNAYSTHQQ